MSALSLKASNDRELEETRRGIIEDLAEYRSDLERVEEEMRLRGLIGCEPEVSQYEKAMRERGEWTEAEGDQAAPSTWEHWWEGELVHSGTYEECYLSKVSVGMWGSIRPEPRPGAEA